MNRIENVSNDYRGATDVDRYDVLKELSHRVCNEYAHVISSITLQARRSGDRNVQAALAEVSERLMRFADVNRALMCPEKDQAVDVCIYLRHLCRVLSRARLDDESIRLIFVESGPQFMPAECCWKLGLSVSELVTNSAKHAFGDSAGVICVRLETSCGAVRCIVLDNGRQRVTGRVGHGLRLITSLVRSIGGTFDYSFTGQGGVSVISLLGLGPISDLKRRTEVARPTSTQLAQTTIVKA